MAEDCVDHAITLGRLADLECSSRNLRIHGYLEDAGRLGPLEVYGADAGAVKELARGSELGAKLNPELPYIQAEVVWAAREEMARTVEDVLARRTRALFLNARAAMEMAEPVAMLMAGELGRDEAWVASQVKEFCALAQQYRVI
jgi:glycerol-3-phosphate dehydrogenase